MANEGEERLTTLFADVHYWFAQPSARPASHRFDKESYVYLYRNTETSRGRLEVANHAGTPEQDAFTGYLDSTSVSQSHRHPTLVTITVDGFRTDKQVAAQSTEWRLPSTDPRDEGKYLFRLHTLDIYFWTKEDALQFVQHCQATLHSQQLNLDYPVAEPHQSMSSPVVQKLENMAVSDPAYNTHRASTAGSVASAVPAPSATEEKKSPSNYVPLAYNPAAPPAPEKRAHREKTPPPPEEPGVGLGHAVDDDHHHRVSSVSHQPYTGIPSATSHSYSPAPSGHSIPSPPGSTAPNSQSYGSSPKDGSSRFNHDPSVDSPTVQILGSSYLTSPTVPLQHLQPQYPDYLAQRQSPSHSPQGSHSKYTPAQASHQYHPGNYYPTSTGDQDIHSQVYRPTEEETHGKPSKPGQAGPGAASAGKWEQKAEKAEKGLNRLLRKVEKKIG